LLAADVCGTVGRKAGSMKEEEKKAAQAPLIPKTLVGKLAKIMGAVGWVEKKGHNKFFNYDYAREVDILDAVRNLLSENSVFMTTSIISRESQATGRTTRDGAPIFLTHVTTLHVFMDGDSGERIEVQGSGSGEDSSDKGVYKAITGAIKYVVTKNFLIPTGDDVENEPEPEIQTIKPRKTPYDHGKPVSEHDKDLAGRIANGKPKPDPIPQRDLGTFMDKVKSGSILGRSQPGEKPWTLYQIELYGHGPMTTFSDTVFKDAERAAKEGVAVFIHSHPGKKGPEIEQIEFGPFPKELKEGEQNGVRAA
jgi:hypothetical protein